MLTVQSPVADSSTCLQYDDVANSSKIANKSKLYNTSTTAHKRTREYEIRAISHVTQIDQMPRDLIEPKNLQNGSLDGQSVQSQARLSSVVARAPRPADVEQEHAPDPAAVSAAAEPGGSAGRRGRSRLHSDGSSHLSTVQPIATLDYSNSHDHRHRNCCRLTHRRSYNLSADDFCIHLRPDLSWHFSGSYLQQ